MLAGRFAYLLTDTGIAGPLGAAGLGETLVTLPWVYTYILGRSKIVRDVRALCEKAGVVPPLPHEVDYFNVAAIDQWVQTGQRENAEFDRGMESVR